jgi:hypothetical protein
MEVWKPVVGFEGLYEVSDRGRVRSLDRKVWCCGPVKGSYWSYRKGRILRPGVHTPSGHVSVSLGRVAASFQVHALVLEAFVGSKPLREEIRHLNGEASDNRLVNLQYATRSRNGQDKKWHRGQSTYRLGPEEAREIILSLQGGVTGADLAKKFKVAQSTISAIKHKKFHRDVYDSL